jgi:two-component system, CitB family, sensor kinase
MGYLSLCMDAEEFYSSIRGGRYIEVVNWNHSSIYVYDSCNIINNSTIYQCKGGIHVRKARLTLRAKLNLFVGLNALLGFLLVASGFSYITIKDEFQDKGEQSLQIAETVADMPQIIQAFHAKNPPSIIEPLVERIRRNVGAEFIVVGNMQLVRYSHPDPSQIGKKMVGGDDEIVLQGKASITKAVGTLGLSIRGKAPIFDANHRQIGVVSVGFLVSDIWKQIGMSLMEVIGLSTGAFLMTLLGAHLLSGHVKRQIFGMEPSEIAQLVQEQSAILQSIQEGILAVDSTGHISACNQQAKRILDLEAHDLLGKEPEDVVPNPRLCTVISDGPDYVDLPMIIGNTMIMVNRVPVLLNNEAMGAVITFRDKMQLDQMERRLEDIERYADALRSQRHEFMNRLHTISGLIQLQEYDLVRELIDDINGEQHQLLSFFAHRIRDPAVLAIIVGKIHRARELGIQLTIDSASKLSEHCPHRDVVVTVLGNAIENALEALAGERTKSREPMVTVYLNDEGESFTLTVKDTGPGIHPQLGSRIFEDGVTTKGPGRGFGLSLCSQMVANANGKLSILSSSQGAILEMVLPKGEIVECR